MDDGAAVAASAVVLPVLGMEVVLTWGVVRVEGPGRDLNEGLWVRYARMKRDCSSGVG